METFEATVRDLSAKGLGVVDHPNGQVFFVNGVWPGDVGTFSILSIKKRYGFAKLETLITPSPERISPPCKHQGAEVGRCGGCPWMIADYQAQLRYKQKLVHHYLTRANILTEKTLVGEIWPSEKTFGYRNRAQLKVNATTIGFVSQESNTIAPIDDCIILSDHNRELLQNLKKKLPNPDWQPSAGYPWNFIEIDDDMDESENSLNTRRPFKQANTAQNQKMQNWLREKLSPHDSGGHVIELFCGSGNFTKIIANLNFANIVAAESGKDAIDKLEQRALKNVQAFALDIFRPSSWNQLKKVSSNPEILVLDPPRRGFQDVDKFVKTFPSLNYIYYISCDINNFASEAKSLGKLGWGLVEVQPVDQFPHTIHAEILASFAR